MEDVMDSSEVYINRKERACGFFLILSIGMESLKFKDTSKKVFRYA